MVKIAASIIISTALLLSTSVGCTGIAGCSSRSQIERAEILLADHPAYEFGELAAFDSNGDGSEDLFVYTFEKEQLDEHLFLQRTVEYKDTETGHMGELVLEFENSGDETKSYSHIEVIPKSFAESVDELEFSTPPDEIINPDPEVRWDVAVVKGTIEKIMIKAKKAAEETGKKAGTEAAQASIAEAKESAEEVKEALKGDLSDVDWEKALASGISAAGSGLEAMKKGQEAGTQAGVEAAIGVILENFDDFAFIHAVEQCGRLKAGTQAKDDCILGLVSRFPGRFKVWSSSVCDDICGGESSRVMCEAIVNEDVKRCDALKDEFDQELCKAFTIKALCDAFTDPKERELCVQLAATCNECVMACSLFKDDDKRNECLAMVTQDKRYCDRIKDEAMRNRCLETIAKQTEKQRQEGATYRIESWFPNELESNLAYSNKFLAILPDAFREPSADGGCGVTLSLNSLECDCRCMPEAHVWTIHVGIRPYPTDIDAREEWLKDLEFNWSPERIENLEAQYSGSTTVVSGDEALFTWEEKIGSETYFYTMKEILYKNSRIYIDEGGARTKSGLLLNDVEAWAKQVIDGLRAGSK